MAKGPRAKAQWRRREERTPDRCGLVQHLNPPPPLLQDLSAASLSLFKGLPSSSGSLALSWSIAFARFPTDFLLSGPGDQSRGRGQLSSLGVASLLRASTCLPPACHGMRSPHHLPVPVPVPVPVPLQPDHSRNSSDPHPATQDQTRPDKDSQSQPQRCRAPVSSRSPKSMEGTFASFFCADKECFEFVSELQKSVAYGNARFC
jgi:hypothetical protein